MSHFLSSQTPHKRPARLAARCLRALPLAALVTTAGILPPVQQAQAAAFTAGNLVTYRVGDGTAALTNAGTAVFLDEYTTTGTLVQSIALPTIAGATAFVASGTATSEGLLNRSSNGQYLAITGYNTAAGTAGVAGTTSASVNRVVNVFDATGNVASSTRLSDFASANNPRSAFVTDDGTGVYATGGAGGVRFATAGNTTSVQLSTTVTNLRNVNITGGQLYVSASSGTTRLATVGTGVPTTNGQTITNLPGISTTNSASPYQFAFADLSSTVAGVDTLYVADDTLTSGGIQKFSLDNCAWTLKGTILGTNATAPNQVRGLTAALASDGTTVNIYASSAGSIFAYADASGYDNFTPNATATVIATATANEAFRGIAFAPTPVPEPTTVLGGVLLVGAAGWTQRRRLRGVLTA